MQITLTDVHVDGRREPMLEPMDSRLVHGRVRARRGEPGHGHTALALVATGRFDPSGARSGSPGEHAVAPRRTIGARRRRDPARRDRRRRRARHQRARRRAHRGRRRRRGPRARRPPLAALRRDPLARRPLARHRPRAAPRPGARGRAHRAARGARGRGPRRPLPRAHPPRPARGEPSGWWEVAQSLAGAGYGVLVQCTRASARDLGADLPPARGASIHQPPAVVLRTRPEPPATRTRSSSRRATRTGTRTRSPSRRPGRSRSRAVRAHHGRRAHRPARPEEDR